MKIFVIGPGGVGKTTCGRILADMLGYAFIDLDEEFIIYNGNIDDYINEHGYERYSSKNSRIFYEILNQQRSDLVLALSSGFFTYGDGKGLSGEHIKTVREQGISILLLPSQSLDESTEIVVSRQIRRGLGYQEQKERSKYALRHTVYKELGDIRIFSAGAPPEIAQKMRDEIEKIQFKKHGDEAKKQK